ncbi:MAG: polysaccharide biosynthesis/export family protein [Chthoniobacter sp.]|uniref:polysaccharide biosynthesis/export family protein n=1 Tax=Chthoniobacter sp. TaxID=2510640 RepID=UPI0032A7CEFA
MRPTLGSFVLLAFATVGLQAASPAPIPVAVPVTGGSIATLRTGDVFEMRLSGMPAEFAADFNLQFTIGQEGTVNVPLIGEVKAVGMTASQLERAIQGKLLADKIFTRPTVLINIAQATRYVSISGGIRAPQRLSWSSDLTLSSAIGNCGGLSDFGSGKGVRIIREGKVAGAFDLKEISKDPSRDPKLLPGDQVIVRE